MGDVFDALPDESRNKLRKRPQPQWIAPMLATLMEDDFSDPRWLFEHKLDGVRCLAFRRGRQLRLMSRNRKEMSGGYPEIVEAMLDQPADDFIVDGEIVAFDGPHTSFARLQGRMGLRDPRRARATGIDVYLHLFDLLYLSGHETTALPLIDRKDLLQRAIRFKEPVRYAEHVVGAGREYLAQACKEGWEGIIAKKIDAKYQPRRSRDWLKLKCINEQEFIVIGYTDPKGSRIGLGALLVGYYEDGHLRYAGKVGTGYSDQMLRDLRRRLALIEQESSSVHPRPPIRDAHWVQPKLVAQVAFSEWTRDGRLRHPRFLGLRADKPAKQVVREQPVRVE